MKRSAAPSSWLWCELGELLLPVASPSGEEFPQTVTYIEISSIDRDAKRVKNPRALRPTELPTRARYVLRPGDVLFGLVRPYLKSIAQAPNLSSMVASSAVSVLRPIRGVSSRFIFYLMQSDSYMAGLLPLQRGVSYPAVTDSDVKVQRVMLPPTREQDLIVQQLDLRLRQLDSERDVARSAQEAIATRRRAHYDSIFASPIPVSADQGDAHAEVRQREALGSLLTLASYGTSARTGSAEHGSPVLRIPNVVRGEIRYEPLHYTAQPLNVSDQEKLKLGDILVIRSNGSIGLVGTAATIHDLPLDGVHFASYIIRLRVDETKLSPEWVEAYFSSTPARDWIERAAKGSTTQHNLSLQTIRSMMIPLLPRSEQDELLQQLQRGLRALEAEWETAQGVLDRVEKDRQQILNDAVTGALVPHTTEGPSPRTILRAGRAERAAAETANDRVRKKAHVKRNRARRRRSSGIESVLTDTWQSGEMLYSIWLDSEDHSLATVEQFYLELSRARVSGLVESRVLRNDEGAKVGDEFRLLPGTGGLS